MKQVINKSEFTTESFINEMMTVHGKTTFIKSVDNPLRISGVTIFCLRRKNRYQASIVSAFVVVASA